MYLDLDNFKQVNDTQGHLAGDKVLSDVTALMKKQLRKGNYIYRLGGDEFAILGNDADAADKLLYKSKSGGKNTWNVASLP